jgi:hypothetical protein
MTNITPTTERFATDPCSWVYSGLLAAALFLGSAQPGAAQAPAAQEPEGEPTSGRGFFQTGYLGLDPEDLNVSLNDVGLPDIASGFVTFGGGGYGQRGLFLIGGEGHAIVDQEEATPNGEFQLSAGGGYGLFRIGYLAYSEGQLDLFPLFGIGGGGLSVNIKGRSAPTFDQVLEAPARSSSLATGGFLLDASIGLNYRIVLSDEEESSRGGLVVGAQAGYIFEPGGSSWTLDGLNNVAGGPDLKLQGFHFRASIGGWGTEEPAQSGAAAN